MSSVEKTINISKLTTFYENSKGNSIKKSFKYSQNKHNQNGHSKPNGIPQKKNNQNNKIKKKRPCFYCQKPNNISKKCRYRIANQMKRIYKTQININLV